MNNTCIPTKWNFSLLGDSLDDPRFTKERAANKKKIRQFVKKWSQDQGYLSNTKKLLQSLRQYEALEGDLGNTCNEGYYLQLRSATETDNPKLKAAYKKYIDFYTPINNSLTFYLLSLGKVSSNKQREFLQDDRLAHYHFFLKGLFNSAKHNLSEKEENLSSLLYGVMAGNWDDMTDEFLSKATEIVLVEEKAGLVEREKGFNEFLGLINSPVQEVRDCAAVAINTVLDRLGDVFEKEFNTFLERKQIYDRLRGYKRPDTYRHLADDIDSKTVDTMLEVVQNNFKLARDYYAFKAKLMGKKSLAYHERNVPVGKIDQTFDYGSSVQIVGNAFAQLDQEFAQAFDMFVQQGRIDVKPRTGKTGGAFCAGSSTNTHTYILLNHTNDLNALTTLAHECGHGVHNELMRPQQSSVYCGTSLATAEVASTFCEEFALRAAMKHMDDEEQFTSRMESLNGHISSIIRQAAFYLFEKEIHDLYRERGYLTRQEVGTVFQKHMKSYMGSSVSYETGSENWWMYVGHFRRPFYVYSYASGEMISMALQNMVYANPANIKNVKQFLKKGCSDSAENIFKAAGIDIKKKEFWQQAFSQMGADFAILKKQAKKLGKV